MNNFFDFMKLIRRQMGIDENAESDFKLDGKFSKLDWKTPEIEITANPNGELPKEFIFTDEGFFYNGRRVILYIRDQVQYFERHSEYKFHLTSCATITAAINSNRYKKYVAKTTADKIFKVNFIVNNRAVEKEIEMRVCKHCLHKLNWKDYKNFYGTSKLKIYKNFSLEEFFASVKNDNRKNFAVLPDYTAETAPLNIYPANWAIISRLLRAEAGYICSDCRRKISDTRTLHVHHRNSIKSDCRRSNLEVLCAACHQKRHNHKILGEFD